MNKTLALTAFVMFAVIMGTSSIAPAFAGSIPCECGGGEGGPPADPRNQGNVPTVDCVELEAALNETNMSEAAKEKLLIQFGCPT